MREYQLQNHPLKNIALAIGMLLFLALSFKLAGDLSADPKTTTLSQTDTVLSTLNQPPITTSPLAK